MERGFIRRLFVPFVIFATHQQVVVVCVLVVDANEVFSHVPMKRLSAPMSSPADQQPVSGNTNFPGPNPA